jgi:hypothetical protein
MGAGETALGGEERHAKLAGLRYGECSRPHLVRSGIFGAFTKIAPARYAVQTVGSHLWEGALRPQGLGLPGVAGAGEVAQCALDGPVQLRAGAGSGAPLLVESSELTSSSSFSRSSSVRKLRRTEGRERVTRILVLAEGLR